LNIRTQTTIFSVSAAWLPWIFSQFFHKIRMAGFTNTVIELTPVVLHQADTVRDHVAAGSSAPA
jgi:hypothetical protein